MNILEIFKKPAKTSDELKEKLAQINAQLPALKTLCDAAEAERGRGLLVLEDKQIEAIEARLARVRRDRDRAEAACAELQRQIAVAERKEAHDELSRRRAEAEKKAERVASRISIEYAKAAQAIASIVSEIHEVDALIVELNADLTYAGRIAEALERVEERVIPASKTGLRVGFSNTVSLPPLGGFKGVGHARDEALRFGVTQA